MTEIIIIICGLFVAILTVVYQRTSSGDRFLLTKISSSIILLSIISAIAALMSTINKRREIIEEEAKRFAMRTEITSLTRELQDTHKLYEHSDQQRSALEKEIITLKGAAVEIKTMASGIVSSIPSNFPLESHVTVGDENWHDGELILKISIRTDYDFWNSATTDPQHLVFTNRLTSFFDASPCLGKIVQIRIANVNAYDLNRMRLDIREQQWKENPDRSHILPFTNIRAGTFISGDTRMVGDKFKSANYAICFEPVLVGPYNFPRTPPDIIDILKLNANAAIIIKVSP